MEETSFKHGYMIITPTDGGIADGGYCATGAFGGRLDDELDISYGNTNYYENGTHPSHFILHVRFIKYKIELRYGPSMKEEFLKAYRSATRDEEIRQLAWKLLRINLEISMAKILNHICEIQYEHGKVDGANILRRRFNQLMTPEYV